MSQNMKALKRCFPIPIRSFITLAENFGKWRPYLELFWGPEISLGGGPFWNRPCNDAWSADEKRDPAATIGLVPIALSCIVDK